MIQAEFTSEGGNLAGFSISGHSLFDERGRDIVCAAVSSAVQLTANGISEILKENPSVEIEQNHINLKLAKTSQAASAFLEAFRLHLKLLAEDYPNTIEITVLEV